MIVAAFATEKGMATVRVLLITDSALVEMGMRMVLDPATRGIELLWRVSPSLGLAECVNGQALDMIVIDLDTQGGRRLGLATRVLGLRPQSTVVTLTVVPGDDEAAHANVLGVKAYLSKDLKRNELDDALRALLKP